MALKWQWLYTKALSGHSEALYFPLLFHNQIGQCDTTTVLKYDPTFNHEYWQNDYCVSLAFFFLGCIVTFQCLAEDLKGLFSLERISCLS